ncbi:UV DNA damage repair endonuclease UvsE [Evansella sp. AB-P1]|uniref:UV DNA damage repair endonuclease UvsE n=1 Tax=Evansella sp. AB-P1 TaxID=3037653 RepID=UPI00241D31E1|nr:UV DNA damage repair endonuclease UvsE [Evansella sp. AB-P1]MDG5788422.1 UV DNA damage repair endonuclease UvsE [Evansella sp. AB-P1]
MRLGYACINLSLPTKFKTCRLATFYQRGPSIIKELSVHNLQNVLAALEWNRSHNILFYRMSTGIVPLGSHEKMTWDWWNDEDILQLTKQIKKYKDKYNMRLSMHPGQFTLLNTPKEDVLERSIADLEYHDKLLQLVGGTDMIIHGGGEYGNLDLAKARFIENYKKLSSSIKRKLRLENDDRTYTLSDVIDIYKESSIPICFDIHHHNCNNPDQPIELLLDHVFTSWDKVGIPKVHISSGKEHINDRRHHDYVFEKDFLSLLSVLKDKDVDIMVEAKMKELAVLKIQKEVYKKL